MGTLTKKKKSSLHILKCYASAKERCIMTAATTRAASCTSELKGSQSIDL